MLIMMRKQLAKVDIQLLREKREKELMAEQMQTDRANANQKQKETEARKN